MYSVKNIFFNFFFHEQFIKLDIETLRITDCVQYFVTCVTLSVKFGNKYKN